MVATSMGEMLRNQLKIPSRVIKQLTRVLQSITYIKM